MVRHGVDGEAPQWLAFSRPGERTPGLKIEWLDDGCRVSLWRADGRVQFVGPIDASPLCDAEASVVDLNADLLPDFIVITHTGGNGLAAQITNLTFLLSSLNGYVAREVFSYDAKPTDLFDLNGDGHPEWVHGMFVSGGVGKDGRTHNYWAYNLLGFSGTNVISANAASREFPKWIVYTHRPNHRNSAELTTEQRRRQWLAAWQQQAGDSKTNGFPNLETVAAEQGRTLMGERPFPGER